MTQEALKELLEAVEEAIQAGDWKVDGACDPDSVIRRSKEALAQPEQEPVAWLDGPHLVVRSDMRDRLNYKGPWVDLGRAIPDKWTPLLYTHPPQRTWVGLTEQDLDYLCNLAYTGDEEFALAVQAKLMEKNA